MSKPGGIVEVFGDFVRVGVADVGNTYQRVMFGIVAQGPPGQMVTTYEAEPEEPMNDRQLSQLIHLQAEQEPYGPAMEP